MVRNKSIHHYAERPIVSSFKYGNTEVQLFAQDGMFDALWAEINNFSNRFGVHITIT